MKILLTEGAEFELWNDYANEGTRFRVAKDNDSLILIVDLENDNKVTFPPYFEANYD